LLELFCAVLSTTIVHTDLHTFKAVLTVNYWFRFTSRFTFSTL